MSRLLVALALVVGCNKPDPGPTCDRVVDHMNEVMKQGLTGHPGMEAQNSRKAQIDFCETKKFSKEMRNCLLSAKDVGAIAECQKLR